MKRLAWVLALVTLWPACKRPQAPIVEDLGGSTEGLESDADLATLSPPWTDTTRTRLDNGLVVFRLREPDTPHVHMRVLIPLTEDNAVRPESAAVLVYAMRADLQRRLGRRGIETDLTIAPDRAELAVHTERTGAHVARESLLRVLTNRPSPARLEAVRRELRKQAGQDRIWAVVAATLLGRKPETEMIRPSVLETLTRNELLAAWAPLTDPRRAVLIVHDGDDANQPSWLERWNMVWRGRGRRVSDASATERIRGPVGPAPTRGRLTDKPDAPLLDLGPTEGRAVVVVGRRIPVTTANDRALARLSHRILQEELDARMSLSGDVALVTLRVSLGGRDPMASLSRALDSLSETATTTHSEARLHQAARLWLGARIVQASLDGEDWTSLWRDALDLSSTDEDAPRALIRDARAMLEVDPKALEAFTQHWLDPRKGKPGWVWVLAGGDTKIRRALRANVKLQALEL